MRHAVPPAAMAQTESGPMQRGRIVSSRWGRALPPVLEAFIAAALGLLLLDGKSFWLDEGRSVAIARLDTSQFWHVVLDTEHASALGYYVLLRGWLSLGQGDLYIRSLSVLLMVIAVLLVYGIAGRLFGRRTAIVAGLLMATSEFAVQFAQEAGPYALMAAASAAITYLFVVAVERDALPLWLLYALISAASLYVHYYLALVVLAHFASLPALGRRRVRWRLPLAAAAFIVVAGVGLGLYGSAGFSGTSRLTPGTAIALFREIAGGSYSLLLVMTIALAAAVAYAVQIAIQHRTGPPTWKLLLVSDWLLIPVALILLAAILDHALLDRYSIICLPPVAILAAVGLARVKSDELLGWMTVGFVALAAISDVAWYTSYPKEDWRDTAAYVVSQAMPGDGIVFGPSYVRTAFAYYLEQSPKGLSELVPIYPAEGWNTSDVVQFPALDTGADSVSRALSGFHRVWVVLSGSHTENRPDVADIQRWLASHGHLATMQLYSDLHILRYDTASGP